MSALGCQAFCWKKSHFFARFFLTRVQVVKRKLQVAVEKKSEKKWTKDVDGFGFLEYLLCMVTTTFYNGKLSRLGLKRNSIREIAGVKVEVAIAHGHDDDYVIDIVIGYGNDVSSEKLAEVKKFVNNNKGIFADEFAQSVAWH